MANPYQAFVGTFVGGAGAAQSQFVTFSFANTANFDAYVPIVITNPATTSISAAAEVSLYRTADGGATWETEGFLGTVFNRPTVAGQVQRRHVYIPTGQFLISVMVGGGATTTFSVQVQTAWVISAYA